jgi:Tfp pilus assembly protein PilO
MNNRIWIIGTAVISIVVLALGWALGVTPVLTQASSNRDQVKSIEETNVAQEARLVMLKEQFQSVDEIEAELEALRVQVPPTSEYPGLLRELSAKADEAGVQISNASLEAATAFTPLPVDEAATGEAAAPVEAPVVDPAAPAQPAAVVAIPMTIAVAGSFDGFMSFVAKLQGDGRLFLVTGMSIADSSGGDDAAAPSGAFTGTINGLIYVVRDATITPVE